MGEVSLRFAKNDAKPLRELAEVARFLELPGDHSVYDKAADAAESGEPLVLVGQSRDEAEVIAELFVANGIERPAVADKGEEP